MLWPEMSPTEKAPALEAWSSAWHDLEVVKTKRWHLSEGWGHLGHTPEEDGGTPDSFLLHFLAMR